MTFRHRNLNAYQRALDFLVVADTIVDDFPRGRAYIAKQLKRAAFSIVLNIAEGHGEFSRAEKARFYRIARRSASECTACLDVCRKLELSDPDAIHSGEKYLLAVLKLLTGLIKRHSPTSESR